MQIQLNYGVTEVESVGVGRREERLCFPGGAADFYEMPRCTAGGKAEQRRE